MVMTESEFFLPDSEHILFAPRVFALFFLAISVGLLFAALFLEVPMNVVPLAAAFPPVLIACYHLRPRRDGVTASDQVMAFLRSFAFADMVYTVIVAVSQYSTLGEMLLGVCAAPHVLLGVVYGGAVCDVAFTRRDHSVFLVTQAAITFCLVRSLLASKELMMLVAVFAFPTYFAALGSLTMSFLSSRSLRTAREDLRHELEAKKELERRLMEKRLFLQEERSAKQLEKVKNATTRLMSGMCDSVFRLSNDLDITEASRALLHLLTPISYCPPDSLHGRNILQFFDPADGKAIRRALTQHSWEEIGSQTASAALQVRIQDDEGIVHHVQMFHTPISDSEHMIALRVGSQFESETARNRSQASTNLKKDPEHGDDDKPAIVGDQPATQRDDTNDETMPSDDGNQSSDDEGRDSVSEMPAVRPREEAQWIGDLWVRFDTATPSFAIGDGSLQVCPGWLDWVPLVLRRTEEDWVLEEVRLSDPDEAAARAMQAGLNVEEARAAAEGREPRVLRNFELRAPMGTVVARRAWVEREQPYDLEDGREILPAVLQLQGSTRTEPRQRTRWPDCSHPAPGVAFLDPQHGAGADASSDAGGSEMDFDDSISITNRRCLPDQPQ